VGELSRFLFLGAVSCAVASAFFWMLARQAGDKMLARMTAVAVVIGSCVAAFLLGSMLL
jgi:putative flippase GtrA